jgi:AraC-like DNA-binding protein
MLRSRLFIRFLVSYMVLLLLVLLLQSGWAGRVLLGTLVDQVEKGTAAALSQMMDTIDMRVSELKNLEDKVPNHPMLLPLFLPEGKKALKPGDYYMITKEFDNFKTANSLIDQMFVYFPADDLVVGTVGKQDFNYVYRELFSFSDLSIEAFRSLMGNSSQSSFVNVNFQTGKGRSALTAYVHTYNSDNPELQAILMVTMNDFSLNKALGHVLKAYSGQIVLQDEKGDYITSSHNMDAPVPTEEWSVMPRPSPGQTEPLIYERTVDGSNYIVSAVRSRQTGWTCLALISSRETLSQVRSLKWFAAAVLSISLLAGTVLAYLFSYGSYHPLKKITALIKDGSKPMDKPPTGENEYDWISRTLVSHLSEKQFLQEKLEKNIPLLRQAYVLRLLKGQFADGQALEKFAELAGMPVEGGQYAVLAAAIDDYGEFEESFNEFNQMLYKYSIGNVLEELANVRGKGISVEYSADKIAVLVNLNASSEAGAGILEAIGEQTVRFFAEHYPFTLTVGIGSMYGHAMDSSKSLREALTAVEYKLVRGSGHSIRFDEMDSSTTARHYYTLQQETVIINRLKEADLEEIIRVLDTVMKQIRLQPLSLNAARCLYFEIINTAMKALSELGSEEYNQVMRLSELPDLLRCETLEQVYKETVSFYRLLCQGITTARENRSNEFQEMLLAYVHEHFADSSLSLSALADRFSVPQSTLSKTFKLLTGRNFVDYVHTLRVNKAKELLKDKNLGIADIALDCGYSELTSFYRNFKKYTGTTPNMLRE